MKNILVTGGTVFVSRYVAEYYVKKGYNVYVLNRNNGIQPEGANLIQTDRNQLGDKLRNYHFDVVFDITAYKADDINLLLNALESYDEYILLSSGAVYLENASQPFYEETRLGYNHFCGKYGTDKIAAEEALQKRNPNAYILRPCYLYGPMNNLYREAFVFDCALKGRKFYLPKDGEMKLQFFHVNDLCRFMDIILEKKPKQHIFNLGNKETVSIRDWVTACYDVAGKQAEFVPVYEEIEPENYFCFNSFEYYLDVQKQNALMPETKPLKEGLKESLEWYLQHKECVKRKPYLEYIDKEL